MEARFGLSLKMPDGATLETGSEETAHAPAQATPAAPAGDDGTDALSIVAVVLAVLALAAAIGALAVPSRRAARV